MTELRNSSEVTARPRTARELERDYRTVPLENFQLLTGENQMVREGGSEWNTDYVIERYVSATDKIIGMLDGTIGDDEAFEYRDKAFESDEKVRHDVLLCLDKSARPVADFVDAFWEQMASPGSKLPKSEFLNIDRVNWFSHIGKNPYDAEYRLGPKDFDIDKVEPYRINAIRALFTEGEITESNWEEEVWNLPTRLDGKNVLIVDEVKNRGGTLFIAHQLLKRAIPEAKLDATYFWEAGRYSIDGRSAQSEQLQMESAPVWYNKENQFGRGIGDVSLTWWQHEYELHPSAETLKRHLGAFALSAPHHDEDYKIAPDELYKKLMQDLSFATYAVAGREVLYVPSKYRERNDSSRILESQGIGRDERIALRDRTTSYRDGRKVVIP